MNDKILNKLDEIISYLKESDDYLKYNDLSNKIKKNKDVMDLIDGIKMIQKKIVKEESVGNNIASLEQDLSGMVTKLNEYPIYQEMNYLQEDLNNTFQDVKMIIEKYLNKKTN